MELSRVIRDCDEKEILTPRQRAVSVRLLAAGGRLHDVVANEAKQCVDLDIWRGSGCDRPGLLVYFVMSASSAISMRCRAMMPLLAGPGRCRCALQRFAFRNFRSSASKNVCLTRMRRVLRVPPEAIFPG
jgi:hypothetical protein